MKKPSSSILSNKTETTALNPTQEKRFQTNLRVNPLIDLNYKIDSLKSSLYPIELKINYESNGDTSFKSAKEENQEDFDFIKQDLEKAHIENMELKRLFKKHFIKFALK